MFISSKFTLENQIGRYKSTAYIMSFKGNCLGPQLAVSGDKPLLEMYFRFVAQSSRSKSIILVVTKVSSRPFADPRQDATSNMYR
jgi:hypothetical protein